MASVDYDVQTKLDAIKAWQTCGAIHPLTCRIKSSHGDLYAESRGGTVVLVCPKCQHVQDRVPEDVYMAYTTGSLKAHLEDLTAKGFKFPPEADNIKWYEQKPTDNE